MRERRWKDVSCNQHIEKVFTASTAAVCAGAMGEIVIRLDTAPAAALSTLHYVILIIGRMMKCDVFLCSLLIYDRV